MKAITISDSRGDFLDFDLKELIQITGERAITSTWKITGTEVIGSGAKRLYEVDDSHEFISGAELLTISSDIVQVIEGEFQAYNNSDEPWLVIRVVDSSEFDVECDDDLVHQRLRERFKNISIMPS